MNAGDIVLLPLPDASLAPGKLRPVALLTTLPGRHGDWLLCGISSKLTEAVGHWDEVLSPADPDFAATGLRVASIVRLNWLATASAGVIASAPYVGQLADERVRRLRQRLSDHLRVP